MAYCINSDFTESEIKKGDPLNLIGIAIQSMLTKQKKIKW